MQPGSIEEWSEATSMQRPRTRPARAAARIFGSGTAPAPCQPHGITVSARQAAAKPCERPFGVGRRPDGKATGPDAGASAGEEAFGQVAPSGAATEGPDIGRQVRCSETNEDEGSPEASLEEDSAHTPVRVGSAAMPAPFALAPFASLRPAASAHQSPPDTAFRPVLRPKHARQPLPRDIPKGPDCLS
jgi:hypothetical protein